MSSVPKCPGCGRPIAAWKLDHCVYCGARFPAEFKQGLPAPDALKWVERPALTPEAARQLEMLKVLPSEPARRSRSLLVAASLASLPVFAIVFYMLHGLIARYSPAAALLVSVAGAGFLLYLVWSLMKHARG